MFVIVVVSVVCCCFLGKGEAWVESKVRDLSEFKYKLNEEIFAIVTDHVLRLPFIYFWTLVILTHISLLWEHVFLKNVLYCYKMNGVFRGRLVLVVC